MPRCVIPYCHRRDTSTHFFPSDPVRRQKWIDFVKSINPKFRTPGPSSCICGAHFETRQYNFSLWIDKEENSFEGRHPRRTLSDTAVPTIVSTPPSSSIRQSDASRFSMAESLPCTHKGTKKNNATSVAVKTHNGRTPASTIMENAARSDPGGVNYTVVGNPNGPKVCIFRPLSQKSNVPTVSQSVLSMPDATTKAATTTTSSPRQTLSSILRVATPTTVSSLNFALGTATVTESPTPEQLVIHLVL